jgi:hypothetical protein
MLWNLPVTLFRSVAIYPSAIDDQLEALAILRPLIEHVTPIHTSTEPRRGGHPAIDACIRA